MDRPILAACFALATSCALGARAAADVLDVYPTHPDNLQGIIDVSQPGDVLLVQPGSYHPIVIPHALTVIGLTDGVLIETDWFDFSAIPVIRLAGPGAGTVRLVGLRAERTQIGFYASTVLEGGGFDRLELLDCDFVNNTPLSPDGGYFGKPAVDVTVPVVYVGGSELQASGTIADNYFFPYIGRPAFEGPLLVARDSLFEGGFAGEVTLHDGNQSPWAPGPLPPTGAGCASFDPAVDGTPGGYAVAAGTYVGQGSALIGGLGYKYYCCEGGDYLSSYDPCAGAPLVPHGYGPNGPGLQGTELTLPQNLSGVHRVGLGAVYTLTSTLGTASGVLLAGTELIAPTPVGGFGSLMVANGPAALVLTSLPPGLADTTFVLPWSTQLIGVAVAFQAWDPQSALGVPVVVAIEP